MTDHRQPVLDDWRGDPWDDPGELYEFEGERPRRNRRTAKWIGYSALIVGVTVLLVAGATGLWLTRQVNPPGSPGPALNFTVNAGDTVDAISKRLEQQDIVTNAGVFRWYVKWKGGLDAQPGYYTLLKHDNLGNIMRVLGTPPAQTFDKVTFPEGFTLQQIATRLAEKVPRFDATTFLTMANGGQIRSKYEPAGTNSLEGLVFPDTYQVASTDTEQSVLERLVNQMQKVGAQTGLDKLPADQAYQDLIIASIVEREAKVDVDRPKIARVLMNRLELGMPLQVDATLFYGQDPKTPFDELKAKDTPYNTYLHTGLPPTPISAPGAASIKAVLNPDPPLAEDACPTNKAGEPCALLFYVLSTDGKTHAFATNARDHQKNVDAWHAAGSPGA